MRITLEADYAIRIACTLMRRGGTVSARIIAEASGITLRFTLKILRKLAADGIVSSQKGATGGYMLAASPDEISLGRIIECIDGPVELCHCIDDAFECSRVEDKSVCSVHCTLTKLSADLRGRLYDSLLSDH